MKNIRGEEITFDDGYAETDVNDISEFQSLLLFNKNFKGYIFRGQIRKSFPLQASFYRNFDRISPNLWTVYKEHLERFKLAIRGRIELGDYEGKNENELLAIGQHYGLSTTLLDWTASPYVALFFAFHEKRSIVIEEYFETMEPHHLREILEKEAQKINEPRSVYFLNAKKINRTFHIKSGQLIKTLRKEEYSQMCKKFWVNKLDDSKNEKRLGEIIEEVTTVQDKCS